MATRLAGGGANEKGTGAKGFPHGSPLLPQRQGLVFDPKIDTATLKQRTHDLLGVIEHIVT